MPCKTMSQLKTLKLNPYDIFDVVLAMSQRCAIFGHSKLALDKSFSYKKNIIYLAHICTVK